MVTDDYNVIIFNLLTQRKSKNGKKINFIWQNGKKKPEFIIIESKLK